jgi:hypothetical protein
MRTWKCCFVNQQISARQLMSSRFNQESGCQALAVPLAQQLRKYENMGGPNLQKITNLLMKWGDGRQREELLKQLAGNVLVGRADSTFTTSGTRACFALALTTLVSARRAKRNLTKWACFSGA